jgi:hypothetical protein
MATISSALASDPKSIPNDGPVTQNPKAKPRNGTGHEVAVNSVVLERRRHEIAKAIEAGLLFRTIIDVKLTEARLAGPFQWMPRSLFSRATVPETVYCVAVKMDIPLMLLAPERVAVVQVFKAKDGIDRIFIRTTVGFHDQPECLKADYRPFPELEQMRAARRRALGKSD